MKVALVGPSKRIGGMSAHVRNLTKGLRDLGDEVVVIEKTDSRGPSVGPRYLSKLLKGFDVVHVQGLQLFEPLTATLIAGQLQGCRCVATAHGFGGESDWWRSPSQRILMRYLLKRFDRLISISMYVENRLANFTGIRTNMIETVYNGIDTARFEPSIRGDWLRQRLGVEDDFVILYVGRLAWNKGLQYLIEGMHEIRKEIPNSKLLVIGRGRLEAVLREQVEASGLAEVIKFLGTVPDEILPRYYACSDVVVAPSIFEPFGLVPLEAMSMRKPVVACSVGGIPEAVHDGQTGLLVPPKDSKAIADAVVSLRNDPVLGERLGSNGRRLVEEQFTLSAMAAKTRQCYGRL
ncbi:MAG TPA: glycosyltransferase family 4 protein [Nitrososphaerales archaeon]|nr:glycosyltransferase family 4 protein [Nitrososphaerales archaeon]